MTVDEVITKLLSGGYDHAIRQLRRPFFTVGEPLTLARTVYATQYKRRSRLDSARLHEAIKDFADSHPEIANRAIGKHFGVSESLVWSIKHRQLFMVATS